MLFKRFGVISQARSQYIGFTCDVKGLQYVLGSSPPHCIHITIPFTFNILGDLGSPAFLAISDPLT